MGKMLLSFAECKKRFGSPYQIDKAVADGRLVKIEPGIYSESGKVSEIEVVEFKYPKGIITFDSAYFYYDMTDAIPEVYHLATPANSVAIKDGRVRQYFVPQSIYGIGITEIEYCGDRVRIYDLERLLIDTARMKSKLASDLYKEVVLAYRSMSGKLSMERIGAYLKHFPKRAMIERILYEEVF